MAAEETIKRQGLTKLSDSEISAAYQAARTNSMRASAPIAGGLEKAVEAATQINTVRAAAPLASAVSTVSTSQLAKDAIAKIPANNWGDKTVAKAIEVGVIKVAPLAGNVGSAESMAAAKAILAKMQSTPLSNQNFVAKTLNFDSVKNMIGAGVATSR